MFNQTAGSQGSERHNEEKAATILSILDDEMSNFFSACEIALALPATEQEGTLSPALERNFESLKFSSACKLRRSNNRGIINERELNSKLQKRCSKSDSVKDTAE